VETGKKLSLVHSWTILQTSWLLLEVFLSPRIIRPGQSGSPDYPGREGFLSLRHPVMHNREEKSSLASPSEHQQRYNSGAA
jgi:hypothetical protein